MSLLLDLASRNHISHQDLQKLLLGFFSSSSIGRRFRENRDLKPKVERVGSEGSYEVSMIFLTSASSSVIHW